jgi:asparagine synthase (glutamine-hydrolysing)
MCGFVGFHALRAFSGSAPSLVRQMGEQLRHRGPDGAGEWVEPQLATALAFRRLAIVDCSELGNQPMVSADGRFVLAVNGEIYNHVPLRKELEQAGHRFRGHADSEVLLEAIAEWGLEPALRRCIGMFALAVVDRRERRLLLARDRLGEKPLYYGWSNDHFFFGSELKAFRPHPSFTPEVDRGALTLYLRQGYVPTPHCIVAGFHKLLPGTILTLPLDGSARPGGETLQRYWSVPTPAEPAFQGSPEDYVDGLEELLRDAVRMQMLADVPVGAFLSGGVDSSTVVSLMQAVGHRPVRTFTIGFPEAHIDESGWAEKVAAHLGCEHTTWRCEDSTVLELAQETARAYSEPFADESALPTLALARLTRQQVTVSLSGDGGDELFHGYGRHRTTIKRWRQLRDHPALGLGWRCGLETLDALTHLLPACSLKHRWRSQIGRGRNQWLAPSLPAYYRHRNSVVKTPDRFVKQPELRRDFFDEAGALEGFRETVSWMCYLDLNTYLPDHVLVKVDRAAMAFSLETRMPLLDHRVVAYAAQGSDQLNLLDGKKKWVLRRLLSRYLPSPLVERRKMGFFAPMNRWLREPLREWGESQLTAERLRREGLLEAGEVRRSWEAHQRGQHDCGSLLWNVLVFQAWHAAFFASPRA